MTAGYGDAVIWAIVLAASAGTFAIRISFFAVFDRLDEVPDRVERVLRYVPAAVLAALVAPGVLLVDGAVALDPGNPRLVAGGVAAVVAWRTESLLATIVAGMGTLWLVTWLL